MENESILVTEDEEEFGVKQEIVDEMEKKIKDDIPSTDIEIVLPSNGRIEGVPTVLHFRSFSALDSRDISIATEENKPNVIGKVLTRMCFEKFNIEDLPVQDIMFILFRLQGAFISPMITREVYKDDTLPEDEIDNEDNLIDVEIPITSFHYRFLGKTLDDVDMEEKIKYPFTVTDVVSNDKIEFDCIRLRDVIQASAYCREYYKDEFLKYSDVRKMINRIRSEKKEENREKMLNKYIDENEDKIAEWENFMNEYASKLGMITQALQIRSYNGTVLNGLTEKWEIYSEKLSSNIWDIYNGIVEKFPFGLDENVKVKIDGKLVNRRVGFQFVDFLQFDKAETTNRYTVSFD